MGLSGPKGRQGRAVRVTSMPSGKAGFRRCGWQAQSRTGRGLAQDCGGPRVYAAGEDGVIRICSPPRFSEQDAERANGRHRFGRVLRLTEVFRATLDAAPNY
jgi:hypothetical protein